MAGPRRLGQTVPEVAGAVLGKRGLAFGALITEWDSIVGANLGRHTVPEKLSFPRGKREDATLTIRAMGAIALELQHLAPQIIERINSFFGYRAVLRLKTLQSPLPQPPSPRPRPRTLTQAETAAVEKQTAGVSDEDLRRVLERFGRSIRASQKR